MNKIRAFLAVDFGSYYAAEIGFLINRLKPYFSDVKWTRPGCVHLTLSFFGEVSEKILLDAGRAIEYLTERHRSFCVNLAGIGAFPSMSEPRVIWAGLEGQITPLLSLKKDIDECLKPAGIMPEERKFHPHLTLGRVRGRQRNIRLPSEILAYASDRVFSVSGLVIFKSELSGEGPLYTPLQKFALPAVGLSKP